MYMYLESNFLHVPLDCHVTTMSLLNYNFYPLILLCNDELAHFTDKELHTRIAGPLFCDAQYTDLSVVKHCTHLEWPRPGLTLEIH